MQQEFKSSPTEFKSEGDQGEFEGHFSIFGNVDDAGDISHPGMFIKTIRERGRRVKLFYAHDWNKLIGPPPKTLQEDTVGLFAAARLTLDSLWGKEAWVLMKDGALTEGSFGYSAVKYDYDENAVRHLREVKLFELSPVPLGANPLTELRAIKSMLDGKLPPGATLYDELASRLALFSKGAIPPHTTAKADENLAWDAGAQVREAEGAAQLRRMHAWLDDDGDLEAKGSYKLPHHLAGGAVVLRGVMAAGGVMMGASGGGSFPSGDVAGIKRHLEGHYHQFDRKAPWEEEAELDVYVETVEAVLHELKAGRVLSAASVGKVNAVLAAVRTALADLEELLASAEPDTHSAMLHRRMRVAKLGLSLNTR